MPLTSEEVTMDYSIVILAIMYAVGHPMRRTEVFSATRKATKALNSDSFMSFLKCWNDLLDGEIPKIRMICAENIEENQKYFLPN